MIGKDFLGKVKFPLIDLLPYNEENGNNRDVVMFDDEDNEPTW